MVFSSKVDVQVHSRGPVVIVTCASLAVLTSLIFAIRLTTRLWYLRNAGSEDLAISISLLAYIACTIATCIQVKYGLGHHFSDVSKDDFQLSLRYLWVAILFYGIALVFVKLSIVLQYLRVFLSRRTRYACLWTLLLLSLYGIQQISSSIFACVPIASFWDRSIAGYCINKEAVWFFNSAMNIFTDIVLIILPMPALSTLQLPPKQKFGLILIFALGGLVCVVSVLRLHSLYIASLSNDMTWDNVESSIWSNIEVAVSIICASLPTLRPLLQSRQLPGSFPSANSLSEPKSSSTLMKGDDGKYLATSMTKVVGFNGDRDIEKN
ncbi:hypothetical protein LZ554_008937 [Drepanopeziza brunnea f. sp. 'monogermtubi']|nr:hypothetical protein LZ554_008937 [Drepanopeziza brunnea f. sp. 'monogermtubi']